MINSKKNLLEYVTNHIHLFTDTFPFVLNTKKFIDEDYEFTITFEYQNGIDIEVFDKKSNKFLIRESYLYKDVPEKFDDHFCIIFDNDISTVVDKFHQRENFCKLFGSRDIHEIALKRLMELPNYHEEIFNTISSNLNYVKLPMDKILPRFDYKYFIFYIFHIDKISFEVIISNYNESIFKSSLINFKTIAEYTNKQFANELKYIFKKCNREKLDDILMTLKKKSS